MAKHEVAVNRITSNDLSNVKIGVTQTYEDIKGYSDFADDDLINKRSVNQALANLNPSPVEYDVPVGTQLTDYGQGYAYRIANLFFARGVVVSSNGLVNFVPYTINDPNLDVYLPDYDGTGKTNQPYTITLGAIAVGGGSVAGKFKSVATYAAMIADGTPVVATIYEVLADENKNYIRSTYIWKPNGNREWIASTPDN